MKLIFKFFLALTISSLMLWSCADNDTIPNSVIEGEGKVSFAFDVVKKTTNKKVSNKKLKNKSINAVPTKIVVTIKSLSDGSLVYEKEELDVIAFNGNYISNPIDLKVGSYELIEYFVLDANGNTIYLTPLEGSALAYLVKDPLGTEFSIAKDDSKQITPEVISPKGLEADDFGYTDFSFDVVNSIDFLLSVHIFDEDSESYELTSANIQITAEGKEVYNATIENKTTQIRVRNEYTSYTITTKKSGFVTNTLVLSNTELISYGNDAVIILLSPNVEKFGVYAKENSISGGEGMSIGSFEVGKKIKITTDPNDVWNLADNVAVNSEGGHTVYDLNGLLVMYGTLVGSFDDGKTYFKIGTSFEGIVDSASELKLYCVDSDKDNNSGSIEVSVQVL